MNIPKVLVIDDNKHEQLLLDRALSTQFTCEVHFADDGMMGLEKITDISPDVIFLDIAMPVMDGITMLEKLRIERNDNTTKVIALTAKSDNITISKLQMLGIEEYLIKPISLEKIFSALEKALK